MRSFSEYLVWTGLTFAALFFVSVVLPEKWPHKVKAIFRVVISIGFFFVIGAYWLTTGEKFDETAFRWVLCRIHQFERCVTTQTQALPQMTPATAADEERRKAGAAKAAEEERSNAKAAKVAEEERSNAEAAKVVEEERSNAEAAKVAEEERSNAKAAKVAEEERRNAEAAKVAEEERRKAAEVMEANLVPQLTVFWKKVCTSARSAEEAEQQLRKAGMSYLPSTIRMIPHWSQSPVCYKVTRPIAASNFAIGDRLISYRDMMGVASKFGLKECPWELAPALRVLVRDQQPGNSFDLAAAPMRREDASDTSYRLPQLGNKEPRPGAFRNPYPGNYLSVHVIGDNDPLVSSYRTYVFCAAQ
jgi:hypothetical protein